ncbi:MAG: TetR family transcriptional regulator [Streptosporangiales bacterium]|nr:TetR family transcriptional regulator [Streptosporangiales bacterium]
MATDFSSTGDPARSLALLWGTEERGRRGPKGRVTVAAIVRAAVDLADREGLGALSMRKIATEVGVGTMSLYTYLPGKAELLDLMLDAVYAETAKPDDPAAGWRARLEQVARENWALYRRHPWMLQVATPRPVLGPNLMAKYEHELRAVADSGLDDLEMDAVVALVADLVQAAARRAVQAREVRARTGMTDEEWWQTRAPFLDTVVRADEYPLASRVGAAVGEAHGSAGDPEQLFEFGLRRVLDGIEVLLSARTP